MDRLQQSYASRDLLPKPPSKKEKKKKKNQELIPYCNSVNWLEAVCVGVRLFRKIYFYLMSYPCPHPSQFWFHCVHSTVWLENDKKCPPLNFKGFVFTCFLALKKNWNRKIALFILYISICVCMIKPWKLPNFSFYLGQLKILSSSWATHHMKEEKSLQGFR